MRKYYPTDQEASHKTKVFLIYFWKDLIGQDITKFQEANSIVYSNLEAIYKLPKEGSLLYLVKARQNASAEKKLAQDLGIMPTQTEQDTGLGEKDYYVFEEVRLFIEKLLP